jgi:hypothetical protein
LITRQRKSSGELVGRPNWKFEQITGFFIATAAAASVLLCFIPLGL